MKQKCPAELNSRVIRIGLKTYELLRELSLKLNLTMAEALDKLITSQREPTRQASVTQPVTQPAFEVRTQPAFEVTGPVALRLRLQPTIATNGSKVTAFRIKPKGVRND